jgi:protein-tyrosine phosphatase
MIDLHTHVIFGLDDGAATLDMSVEMCRQSVADGVEVLVATPHRVNGVHPDVPVAELQRRLYEIRTVVGDSVRLELGCELHVTHTLVEDIRSGHAPTIAGGPWVLIEFPPLQVPHGIENAIYELASSGYKLLVAHPERNRDVQRRMGRFINLMELGLYCQLDAASVLGRFGKEAMEAARFLLDCNRAHAIASDCHSPTRRRPRLSEAFRAARNQVGEEYARALVVDNPRAIVEGRSLPYMPEPRPLEERGSRWRRLLRV